MADNTKAQPGSHESGTGGETSTTGGDSQVDVKNVLNTNETGEPPKNVNTVPDDSSGGSTKAQPGSHESGSGGETSTTGGDSQVDVKNVLNTNETGEPPKNVNN